MADEVDEVSGFFTSGYAPLGGVNVNAGFKTGSSHVGTSVRSEISLFSGSTSVTVTQSFGGLEVFGLNLGSLEKSAYIDQIV